MSAIDQRNMYGKLVDTGDSGSSVSKISCASGLSENELRSSTPNTREHPFLNFLLITILLILCVGFGVALFVGLNKVITDEFRGFQQQVLIPICQTSKTMSRDDYEEIFSEDYRRITVYEVAQDNILEAFPAEIECSRFDVQHVIDIFVKEFAFKAETTSTENVKEFSYPLDDEHVTIYFVQEGGDWRIDRISAVK